MASHFQGRLDLDKFRRFRDKSRKSLGLPVSSEEPHEEFQYLQIRRHQSTGSIDVPNASEELLQEEGNQFSDKRKTRFTKFRERRRESHSPSMKTVPTSSQGFSEVEGSPLRPIDLGNNSGNLIDKRASSSEPRDDSSFVTNRSYGTHSTVPLSQVSSHGSTRSSGRDRIEESRTRNYDAYNRKAANKFRSSRNREQANNMSEQTSGGSIGSSASGIVDERHRQKSAGRNSLDGSTSYSKTRSTLTNVQTHQSKDSLSPRRSCDSSTASTHSGGASNQTEKNETHPRLDQRTVRLLYSREFVTEISRHRNLFSDDRNENDPPSDEKSFNFYVRKKALSPRDTESGDFDVVVVEPDVSKSVVVYQTKIQPDLKTKVVIPVKYQTDRAFSEHCSSEEFYVRVGQPLVAVAKHGGMATAIVFGQQDSGKDSTMTEIEERVAFDIFEPFESLNGVHSERPASVAIQMVELVGNVCTDLIGQSKSTVQVVAKEGGAFRIKGAETKPVNSAKDLIYYMRDAKLHRVEKYRNNGSLPYCHLLCQIFIRQEGRRGSLTLLECAGVDHLEGEVQNTCEQESKKCFDNLMACVRARSVGRRRENSYIPYRSCNLTKILQENLDREDSRVSIIASVSPRATDTEATMATMNTLFCADRRGSNIDATNKSRADDLVLPRQWNHSELRSFLSRKQLLAKEFPVDINGRMAFRMSKLQLKSTFFDKWDDVKAEKLYIALRAENDRIARIRVKRRIAIEKQTNGV